MPTSPQGRRGAWPALAAVAFAVTLVHLALIGQLRPAGAPPPAAAGLRPPPPTPALLTRWVASDAADPASLGRAADDRPALEPTLRHDEQGASERSHTAFGRALLNRDGGAAPTPAQPRADAPATESTPPEAGDRMPPVYPTRPPPAMAMAFELRRGGLSAWAQLVWQPGAGGYALRLQASLPGGGELLQVSQGQFDDAGLAPERFVETRAARPARAINFQRAAARVSFSASQTLHALWPGSQDPLSWLVQLAAIVEADPPRFEPGTAVRMAVAGVQGDMDAWHLAVVAREDLRAPASDVPRALRLRRERRHPHDASLEVWLDPARHHLPARMQVARDGQPVLEWWAASPPASASPAWAPGRVP